MHADQQNKRRGSFAGLLIFLFISGAAAAHADAPSLQRQSELLHFVRHDCGSCHGLTMGGGLGPALTPEALADRHPYALRMMILHGVSGTPMPAWRGVLSEDEAAWIARLLKEGIPPPRREP
jgi:cytochrome c55X